MIKGLERLFQLRLDINTAKDKLNDIEKELKALEIIKDKKVDVWCFTRDCMNLTYKQFLKSRGLEALTSKINLTSQEYDLLKEVLK